MMPTVRISDDTLDRLKEWAEPLQDTVDDAIQKVLDAAVGTQVNAKRRPIRAAASTNGASPVNAPPSPIKAALIQPSPQQKRSSKCGKLPQKEFRPVLMWAVYKLEKSASKKQVCKYVHELVKDRLSTVDYEPVKTGEARWLNAVCWERSNLVKEGLFRNDSERGMWEMSEKGVRLLEGGHFDAPNKNVP